MNLPNYFLADLPPEAKLTAGMLAEACQSLKRNRARYLAERSTAAIIATLAEVARGWLEPENPFRRRALELGPALTGFSPQTLGAGLDALFSGLNADALATLVQQDLGHAQRLDFLCASETEKQSHRAALAAGPELLAHWTDGVVPGPIIAQMVLGLLTRSAQFVRCELDASFLPRLFAHSLYELEPKLGACLELADWPEPAPELDQAVFAEADCLSATGSEEALARLEQRVPIGVRFLGQCHRLSLAYVTQEVLGGFNPQKVAARAARDVIAWDQLGPLAPHVIQVETGGRVSPENFAELLAAELAAAERRQPRGPLPPQLEATIHSRRAFYQVRTRHSDDTRLWCSPDSTAWTVVYENDPRFQTSCGQRFIYVKAVADLTHALQGADAIRGRVATVGLAAPEHRAHTLAGQLARWGVPRICPLGQMQDPPLCWRWGGRPRLLELVTWADWEAGE